jgi:hypothetical protein
MILSNDFREDLNAGFAWMIQTDHSLYLNILMICRNDAT